MIHTQPWIIPAKTPAGPRQARKHYSLNKDAEDDEPRVPKAWESQLYARFRQGALRRDQTHGVTVGLAAVVKGEGMGLESSLTSWTASLIGRVPKRFGERVADCGVVSCFSTSSCTTPLVLTFQRGHTSTTKTVFSCNYPSCPSRTDEYRMHIVLQGLRLALERRAPYRTMIHKV